MTLQLPPIRCGMPRTRTMDGCVVLSSLKRSPHSRVSSLRCFSPVDVAPRSPSTSSPARSFDSEELYKPIRGGIAERDGNSLQSWLCAHSDIVVSKEIETRRHRERCILAPKSDDYDDAPTATTPSKDDDLTIAGFIEQRGGMPSKELIRCLGSNYR